MVNHIMLHKIALPCAIIVLLLTFITNCVPTESITSNTESNINTINENDIKKEQLKTATTLCSIHSGLARFEFIDIDHYYAVCNDNMYFISAYKTINKFKPTFIRTK